MSTPETPPEAATEQATAATTNSSPKNKKLIIIVGAVLFIAIAVGGFLKFKPASKAEKKTAQEQDKTVLYIGLDEFIVNLDKGDKQPNFLKMSVSLQVKGQAMVDKVKIKIPVIRDAFHIYLRELRIDDLQGSAAVYRLREELVLRVNYIMSPDQIDDVLFREILVQ
jgi:flagellar FliL protein